MNTETISVALEGFNYIGAISAAFVFLGIVTALFWPLIREGKARKRRARIIRACLLRPLNVIDSKLQLILDGEIEASRLIFFEEDNKNNFDRIELLLEKSDCLTKKEFIILENYIDYFKRCTHLSSSNKNGVYSLQNETNNLIVELYLKKQYPKPKKRSLCKRMWKRIFTKKKSPRQGKGGESPGRGRL